MRKHCFSFTKPAFFPGEEGGFSESFGWMVIILLVLGLTGCQASSSQAPTPTTNEELVFDPTATQTPLPPPSKTPISTETPVPSETATPTDTPEPTHTPTSTPTALPEGVELVNLRTSDGCDLIGYLHRSDVNPQRNLAVVLSHGWFKSHEEWEEFAPLFVENGFTTMTFDYRGHGASSCSDIGATIGVDVETVVKFLRKEGFARIACIGGSRGALGCLAVTLLTDIDGLVMISGATSGIPELEGLIPNFDRGIQNLTMPKIFMVTEQDLMGPGFVEAFLEMAEKAGEPKSIYVFPGLQHSTGLLIDEDFGEEVQEILLDFVIDLSQ